MKTHHATAGDPLPFQSGIPTNAYKILETQGKGLGDLLDRIEDMINGRIAEGDNPCTALQEKIPGIDWTFHTFEVDPNSIEDGAANKSLLLTLEDIINASDYFWSYLTDDGELCVLSADIMSRRLKHRFYADSERHDVSDYIEAEDGSDGVLVDDDDNGESWGITALKEYKKEVPTYEEFPDGIESGELSMFALILIEMIETIFADGPIIGLLTKEESCLRSTTD